MLARRDRAVGAATPGARQPGLVGEQLSARALLLVALRVRSECVEASMGSDW